MAAFHKLLADKWMALTTYIINFGSPGSPRTMNTMTPRTFGNRPVVVFDQLDSMDRIDKIVILGCWNRISLHVFFVRMTGRAGGRKILSEHLAGRVRRGKDLVNTVTIDTGGDILIPLFEQQMPMFARSVLLVLVRAQTILPHHLFARMTRRAEFYPLRFGGFPAVPGTGRLGAFDLKGARISPMADITRDPPQVMDILEI
jgi:hypothetical protein